MEFYYVWQAKITKRTFGMYLKIIQKWLLKKDITAAFINWNDKVDNLKKFQKTKS